MSFQRLLGLQRQLQGQHGAIDTEDVWAAWRWRNARPPPIRFGAGGSNKWLASSLQSARLTGVAIGVHQQVALGQKAGKQHAVPVLVGDLGDQVRGGLGAVKQLAASPSARPWARRCTRSFFWAAVAWA
jgi:hypothetical protein